MSEYWVAHKKYFCKYCNIYIADDAPSRRQHESGLRHKGNVERFVRGLYKAGEKRKHDLEEEKREMAQVEKAAQAAYAKDVGAGLVKPSSSSAVAGPSSAAPASKNAAGPKPSNPFANYSTAESLGFTDPDEERRKGEAARRQQEGVAGEWEVVEVAAPSLSESGAEDVKPEAGDGATRAGEKRPAEQLLDEEDTRGWKLRRKKVNVGLDDLYDPGALPIKLKTKKEEPEEQTSVQANAFGATPSGGSLPGGTEKPRWSARGWNKPGASSHSASDPTNSTEVTPDDETQREIKSEDPIPSSLYEEPLNESHTAAMKTEDAAGTESTTAEAPAPAPSSGSLFKKRRVPAGGSRGGRRT